MDAIARLLRHETGGDPVREPKWSLRTIRKVARQRLLAGSCADAVRGCPPSASAWFEESLQVATSPAAGGPSRPLRVADRAGRDSVSMFPEQTVFTGCRARTASRTGNRRWAGLRRRWHSHNGTRREMRSIYRRYCRNSRLIQDFAERLNLTLLCLGVTWLPS
jgi:hypothetical protein